MKKVIPIILILLFTLSITIAVSAEGSELVNVIVDSKIIDFPDAKPFINEDNRTLVPVRFVSEALGAKVSWDNELKQVGIDCRGKDIKLGIGDTEATVDDEKLKLDTAAVLKDERTYVPLRFIGEALGASIDWDNDTKTVSIKTVIEIPEFPEIDEEKILEELSKYPTDFPQEHEHHDLRAANKSIENMKLELGLISIGDHYTNTKTCMELLFNRDYRDIPGDYKDKLLYYFHGWYKYRDQEKSCAPEGLVDNWIKDTITDGIIQQAIFVTDPTMVYNNYSGHFKIRGRLIFNYTTHSNKEKIFWDLDLDNEVSIDIGKWYSVDVDVVFASPVTNAPRPAGSKPAPYSFYQIDYLSDFKVLK